MTKRQLLETLREIPGYEACGMGSKNPLAISKNTLISWIEEEREKECRIKPPLAKAD
jgi:hypothetical protein